VRRLEKLLFWVLFIFIKGLSYLFIYMAAVFGLWSLITIPLELLSRHPTNGPRFYGTLFVASFVLSVCSQIEGRSEKWPQPWSGMIRGAAWVFHFSWIVGCTFGLTVSLLAPFAEFGVLGPGSSYSIAAGGFLAGILFWSCWLRMRLKARSLRTRNPNLCIVCGYDLIGLNRDRCPECGSSRDA